MHRFHLPPERCGCRPLELDGPEARHAAQVLRLKAGDPAVVMDGSGGVFHCTVSAAGKRAVKLEVERENRQPPALLKILLFQAVPKGKTMDAVIQKATELGVAEICPVLTERAVPDLDGERLERKGEKWQQIAVEACKQCGQVWLPKVLPPQTWAQALARQSGAELHIVASLQPDAALLRRHLEDFLARTGRKPASVGLWIGPEGDFTPEEIAELRRRDARPITLGPLTLRVETAAICALSLLNAEYW